MTSTRKKIRFVVNGAEVHSAVPEDTPLLYVLRNDLGLKGTRAGCGVGACGSCTVMVEGRAVQSCSTPLWDVQNKDVTTVEGLGSAEHPHRVQQAFLNEQAAQCGYCINGVMLTVASLMGQSEPPSEASLRAALDRHLCRCGTHMRILRAARRVLDVAGPAS